MKLFKPRFNQRSGTPDSELKPNPVRRYPACNCLGSQVEAHQWQKLKLHDEIQDEDSDAWKSLEEYIDRVDAAGGDELNPMDGIGHEMWEQVVTLPPSIGKLKSVRFLSLYGSHLVRIPPEIGEMTNLEEFDPIPPTGCTGSRTRSPGARNSCGVALALALSMETSRIAHRFPGCQV